MKISINFLFGFSHSGLKYGAKVSREISKYITDLEIKSCEENGTDAIFFVRSLRNRRWLCKWKEVFGYEAT